MNTKKQIAYGILIGVGCVLFVLSPIYVTIAGVWLAFGWALYTVLYEGDK